MGDRGGERSQTGGCVALGSLPKLMLGCSSHAWVRGKVEGRENLLPARRGKRDLGG